MDRLLEEGDLGVDGQPLPDPRKMAAVGRAVPRDAEQAQEFALRRDAEDRAGRQQAIHVEGRHRLPEIDGGVGRHVGGFQAQRFQEPRIVAQPARGAFEGAGTETAAIGAGQPGLDAFGPKVRTP